MGVKATQGGKRNVRMSEQSGVWRNEEEISEIRVA